MPHEPGLYPRSDSEVRTASRQSSRPVAAGPSNAPAANHSQIIPWKIISAVMIASLCGGCSGTLDPHGPIGGAEKLILINSIAIMLTIVIPTILATLGIAWWFRASNARAAYQPTFVYSGRIELIVWSIPILTILLLGGIAWIGAHQLDPAQPLASEKKPLEVQVVSLDWKWLFIYPAQHVASVNQLAVPISTPIHFSLTSASVMNAFFVPQLGSMIYTMNGMTTHLNLQADKTGSYHGLSSQYSGDGFSGMGFELYAMTDEAFSAWVAKAHTTGSVLDEKAYADLAKQSQNVQPTTYRDVTPNLFQAIASRKLPPGPGPDDIAQATTVSPGQER